MTTTTPGYDALMHEFSMSDDDYYTTVGTHFAVCDVLMVVAPEAIPARWAFSPSPLWDGTLEGYDAEVMMELFQSRVVTVEDLVAYGDFLAAHAAAQRPEGE